MTGNDSTVPQGPDWVSTKLFAVSSENTDSDPQLTNNIAMATVAQKREWGSRQKGEGDGMRCIPWGMP